MTHRHLSRLGQFSGETPGAVGGRSGEFNQNQQPQSRRAENDCRRVPIVQRQTNEYLTRALALPSLHRQNQSTRKNHLKESCWKVLTNSRKALLCYSAQASPYKSSQITRRCIIANKKIGNLISMLFNKLRKHRPLK